MKKIIWKLTVVLSFAFLTACAGGPEEFTVTIEAATEAAATAEATAATEATEATATAEATAAAETTAAETTVATEATAAPEAVVTREIWCPKGEQRLYGVASIPPGEGEFPLVIFSHGLDSTSESGKIYADRLAADGVAVYCFDFCGGSDESKSSGKTTEMSVMTEVDDLRAVLDAAKTWEFVDEDRIVLLGLSQGGTASALAAARWEDEIAGLILCYPAFLLQEEAHSIFESRENIPDTYDYRWLTVGRRYFEDIWDLNIYNEITKYTKKVLLLHGDQDQTVDISYSARAAEVYDDAEFYPIAGADHYFSGEALDEAYGYITEYLQEIEVD